MTNIITNFKNSIYFSTNIHLFIAKDHTVNQSITSINFDLKEIIAYSEISNYEVSPEIKYNLSKIKYFLKNKCLIFFAVFNNEIIGHYIVSKLSQFRPYPYLNSSIFNKNDYYIFFCRTINSYRGRGVYPSSLRKIVKELSSGNRILISTDVKNTPSIRGIIKSGFMNKGTLSYRSLFGINLIENFKNLQ